MTNPNPSPTSRFTKGDPRINRHGRPKSFDALRELSQQIAHEEAKGTDGEVIVINGRKVTIAEAILRKWASSKDPRLQQAFIEIAFGKVPQNLNLNIDISSLADDQLERIARGEPIANVIKP